MSVPGDVTAEGFASQIIKATIDKYGALHILVNNAGQLSLVLLHTGLIPAQSHTFAVARRFTMGSKQLCQLCIAKLDYQSYPAALSANVCAELGRMYYKAYSVVKQHLLPVLHRVHMGRSHTQNDF